MVTTWTCGDSATDLAAWDAFVAGCPDGGVLQSSGWAAFKRQAGWRPLRILAGEPDRPVAGAQVLLRSLPLGLGALAYCPRGPIGAWRSGAAAGALWPAVHTALRRRRAIFLKIEPNAAPGDDLERTLQDLGFRRAGSHVQPVVTLQVELQPELTAIAAAQKSKTRYNIGLAARKGVVISEGSEADLPAVYPLLQETSQRDGFPIHTLDYYTALLRGLGPAARLTIARHEGDLLAAVFAAAFGREAIYLHGASGALKRNLMATYLIQWDAMQWARSRGCAFYDLWGIPEDATGEEEDIESMQGGLWGVYRFKRGFGGSLVRYAGSYDYVYSHTKTRLWNELLPRYRALLLRRLGMRNDR